jgi:hypothetical protein
MQSVKNKSKAAETYLVRPIQLAIIGDFADKAQFEKILS